MTATHTRDQDECIYALEHLGIRDAVKPLPGNDGCDSILQIGDDAWMIASMAHGRYEITVLEDCTKADAFAFFDAIRKKGEGWQEVASSARGVFLDNAAPEAN